MGIQEHLAAELFAWSLQISLLAGGSRYRQPARAPHLWEHRALPGPLEIVTAEASLEQRVERELEQKANAFSRTLLELP